MRYLEQLWLNRLSLLEKYGVPAAITIWSLVVFVLVLHHEMWRDEVRALSIAVEPSSFIGLFSALRNEGHPVLWYALLRLAYFCWPTPVVLQVCATLVGLVSVILFAKFSPFPFPVRLTFMFGMLPLIEYTVMARNYGISMLLFFCLAMAYTGAGKRSALLVGTVVALTANTNYLALFLMVLFFCFWAVESLFRGKDAWREFLAGAGIAVAGIILAAWTVAMDANSSQAPPEYLQSIDYLSHLWAGILEPGQYLTHLIGGTALVRHLFVAGLILGLLVRPLLALLLFVAFVAFNVIGGAILFPQARHQGVMIMFALLLYWIALADRQKRPPWYVPALRFLPGLAVLTVLLPLFVLHVTYDRKKIREEIDREASSASAIGRYINTNRQLAEAIILGDPDYKLQALPYYCQNRIYIVREKRFSGYVRYEQGQQEFVTLDDLLSAAQRLHRDYRVPILILLGHWNMEGREPFDHINPYKRNFVTNREQIRRFTGQTLKLAEFNHALSDENFQMFLYMEPVQLKTYQQRYGDRKFQLQLNDKEI